MKHFKCMEFTVVPPRKRSGPHTLRRSLPPLSLAFSFHRACPFPTGVISTLGSTLKSYESFPSYLFHPVERSRCLYGARYSAARNSAIRESFKRGTNLRAANKITISSWLDEKLILTRTFRTWCALLHAFAQLSRGPSGRIFYSPPRRGITRKRIELRSFLD